MVFYFSGTGNSTFVATTIANFTGQKLIFIPEVDYEQVTDPEDNFILVFPVYSWGVPPLVSDFVKNIKESYFTQMREKNYTIHVVMTCGDEVALAPEMIVSTFKTAGMEVTSIWSVIMPNNYVLLPGFDIDTKEVEKRKLQQCEKRILEIVEAISREERRIDVVRGSMAWLKSKLIFPLFKKWGIFPKKWHYTDACISCGKCEKICPLYNVRMKEQHPIWGNQCCSCLGCYHVCPVHAVEYGKETRKKGQYLFPLKKISSLHFHK